LSLDLDDFLGCRNLAAQRRFLDHCGNDVRGQGQIGRLQLKTLKFGRRHQRFDLTPRAAEHVRRIGHHHLRGV
jgi:hypothetical protein